MFKKVLHNVARITVVFAQIFGTAMMVFITIGGWSMVVKGTFHSNGNVLLGLTTVASIGLLMGTFKLVYEIVRTWRDALTFKRAIKNGYIYNN